MNIKDIIESDNYHDVINKLLDWRLVHQENHAYDRMRKDERVEFHCEFDENNQLICWDDEGFSDAHFDDSVVDYVDGGSEIDERRIKSEEDVETMLNHWLELQLD